MLAVHQAYLKQQSTDLEIETNPAKYRGDVSFCKLSHYTNTTLFSALGILKNRIPTLLRMLNNDLNMKYRLIAWKRLRLC